MIKLYDLLVLAQQYQASDLHLQAGMPPQVRVHGVLTPLPLPLFEDSDLEALLRPELGDAQWQQFQQHCELDCALDMPPLTRVRMNLFHTVRGSAAVLRLIPLQVPTLEGLALPDIFRKIAELPHGLVLFTGATGSGKSTSMAAMVDYINRSSGKHIITIEDPVEFVHSNQRAIVSQREVHRHTHSFARALKAALREDPDVILLGEMRDTETIAHALTAAETGHLVLATLHTNSAVNAIDRIVDVFAANEKEMVRVMLAQSLRAVIAQKLLPAADGKSRVAAHEILLANAAVRNLIRENKTAQIYNVMQTAAAAGMQTWQAAVEQLQRQGKIDRQTAQPNQLFFEQNSPFQSSF